MKYLFSFTMACCLLLSSCSDSTEPSDTFSTDAKDYMFAGNPGTELVYTTTDIEVDTNGLMRVSPSDTIIITIMERNVLHPIGGLSIRYLYEIITSPQPIDDSTYFSYYNNGIYQFSTFRDTSATLFLNNPLSVGSKWASRMDTFTVKSVGEMVNTTFKSMKSVRVEMQNSSTSPNQEKYNFYLKYYYAPEVFLAKGEDIYETIYPSGKKKTRTTITDLIRYTKK